MKLPGIKLKLLLIFALVLIVITVVNIGLTISLTNQQSERDAFTSLNRQTIQIVTPLILDSLEDVYDLQYGRLLRMIRATHGEVNEGIET